MLRKQKEDKEEILKKLKERFGYSNDLEAPKLLKVVVNRGISVEEGKAGNALDDALTDMTLLCGQKPVFKKAKKSIATFKVREGMTNGVMATLRRDRMFAFFDRLISVAAPRIRDFRGFKIKGDGNGNFTVGIEDQRIFVELENRTKKGFMFTIVTSANSDEEGRVLLEEMGFPFSK